MKKSIIILFIIFLGCEKPVTETKVTIPVKEKLTTVKIKYVNAISGLNYRAKPEGEILGKLNYNEEVLVVKRTKKLTEIRDNGKIIKGEWVGLLKQKDTVYVFDGFLSDSKNKVPTNVWTKFPIKNTPLIDSTNFDNIQRKDRLTNAEIKLLQLEELYPKLLKNDSGYEAYPSYQLNLGNFKSIVTTIFKGEHELESVLIVYNEDDKLIKSYQDDTSDEITINSLIISYDEIAEGWSRTTSEIKNKCITKIDGLYTDTPKIDTTLHHVNQLGYINKVNLNFKNNIRTHQALKLHTIYTDTIQFKKYNDDYDYFFLEGEKNNKFVSLIYNWDVSKNYNFKENDLIKVMWKYDTTHVAGDGETLYFSEFAVDAEKIE